MFRRSSLLAFVSLASLALANCEQPTDSPPASLQADAATSEPTLTYLASRADFTAQFPDLPVEGFEAGNVADGDVVGCPGPLDATSNNRCFAPGGIKPGIQFNSDHRFSQNEGGQEVALIGRGFSGVAPSKQLVATFDVDALLIDFTTTVTAAGMDLVSYSDDTCQIDVFGTNGVLLGSTTAPCNGAGSFWGVSSSQPITRIRVYSPTNRFEGVDNVSFGAAAQAVPPIAAAGGPYSGVEADTVQFDGGGSSDPGGAALTFQWDFGDGTQGSAGERPRHAYADNGSYTVTLAVSNGTLTSTATTTATIANVAPALGSITGLPIDPVQVGTSLTAGASFTDPGILDTHSGMIDWGDGAPSTCVVIEVNGSGSVACSHTYTSAGVFSVTLRVTDKDGGAAQSVFQWVVVFDPVTAFVTGGGWFDSPAGSYAANTSLTGKASFGFVARYKSGTATPSGNTEFKFPAAGLTFHATSYDWLVIAGSKVQLKGSGTINGAGDFGFLLTAVDGAVNGGHGGNDTFRIKIYDKVTGAVIYDNNMGSGDGTPASTVLGGGSIVIHQ